MRTMQLRLEKELRRGRRVGQCNYLIVRERWVRLKCFSWFGGGKIDEAEVSKTCHPRPTERKLVGTGRFELPTPRTPSECSTRLSHVPTRKEPAALHPQRMGFN